MADEPFAWSIRNKGREGVCNHHHLFDTGRLDVPCASSSYNTVWMSCPHWTVSISQ